MILTNIFNYIFSIVVSCFNALDVDLFGVGFTVLDSLIAIALIALVFKFLGKSFESTDKFNFLSILSSNTVLKNISNRDRENQLTLENKILDNMDKPIDYSKY